MINQLSEESFQNLARQAVIWAEKILRDPEVRKNPDVLQAAASLAVFVTFCAGYPAISEKTLAEALGKLDEEDEADESST